MPTKLNETADKLQRLFDAGRCPQWAKPFAQEIELNQQVMGGKYTRTITALRVNRAALAERLAAKANPTAGRMAHLEVV